MFKTQFKKYEHEKSNSGSPLMNEYGYKYNKDGSKNLVVQSQTNVHERIQVDKDSCDINLIVKRFVAGDTSALDKVKGFYADTTDFPTNYADMLQKINDGNVMFAKLPTEIKEKFNNSADEFWAQYGTDSWLTNLGLEPIFEPVEKPVEKSVEKSIKKSVESEGE